jgi:hypothetical protein
VAALKRKRTTVRAAPWVTAESVATALLGFEWDGGPYHLELTGDFGCPQIWASDRLEAWRVMGRILEVCGVSPAEIQQAVITEGYSSVPRFSTVRRYRLRIRDGLAMVSDRVGPGGTPSYPVVLTSPDG